MSAKGIWISPSTYMAFSERTSLAKEIATRERSIDFAGLAGYLPNPDPILKKMGKDIAVYRDLLADAHVAACVESRRAGVLSLLWEIDRGKSKSRQAKFIEDLFDDLDVISIVSDALDGALFGYAPLEVNWHADGSRIVPAEVVGKPSDWFTFGDRNELRFRVRGDWSGEEVPPRKFLIARHRASYHNPYGQPALGPCFWPLTFKKGSVRFWATFTERYGMPWVYGKHAPGTSKQERDDFLDMLQRMVQDGIAIIPENAQIEFADAGAKTASAQIYKALTDYANAEISKALLGQTLTTQVGDRGSYAASKTHNEVRENIIGADRRMVESVMNTLIDWVVDLNFGPTADRPRFVLYAEEDVDKDQAERDAALANTNQIRFTKVYWQRAYGFADDEIEVTEPPAATAPAESGKGPAFAESSPPTAVVDDITDRLTTEAPADDLVEPIRRMVAESSSYAELQEKLLDAYPEMDTRSMGATIQQAFVQAELAGRFDVQRETEAG